MSECLQRLLTAHNLGDGPAYFLSLRDQEDQEPLAVVLDIIEQVLHLDENALDFLSIQTLSSVVCHSLKVHPLFNPYS